MTKKWSTTNPEKVWNATEIAVSLDGKIVETIPLSLIVKEKLTLERVVLKHAPSVAKGEFFVAVDGLSISQEDAGKIDLSKAHTIKITTNTAHSYSLLAILEDNIRSKPEDTENPKRYHQHPFVKGSHKLSDQHRSPEAQEAHVESVKKSGQ